MRRAGGKARTGSKASPNGATPGRIEQGLLDAARRFKDDLRLRRDRSVPTSVFESAKFDDSRFDGKLEAFKPSFDGICSPRHWRAFVERFNDAARRVRTTDGDDGPVTRHTMFFVPIVGPAAQVLSLIGDATALDDCADALVETSCAAPVARFVHGSISPESLALVRPGLLRAILRQEADPDRQADVDAGVVEAFEGVTATGHRQAGPGGDPQALVERILVGFRSHLYEDDEDGTKPVDDLDDRASPDRLEHMRGWLGHLRGRHGEDIRAGMPDSPGMAAVNAMSLSIASRMAEGRRRHGVPDDQVPIEVRTLLAVEGLSIAFQFRSDCIIGPFDAPSELLGISIDPFQELTEGFPEVMARTYYDRHEFMAALQPIKRLPAA